MEKFVCDVDVEQRWRGSAPARPDLLSELWGFLAASGVPNGCSVKFGAHVLSQHTGTRHGQARQTTIIHCVI